MDAIFVGTLDGIFKIARFRETWKIESKDLTGAEINCLVVRADRREVIYAGARGGGLYRSEDGGKSWKRLGDRVLSDKIRALALDPSDPKVVYVGTEPASLWRTEDEGKTWNEIFGVKEIAAERQWTYPVPAIQPHVRSIAVDPRDSRKICLAAQVGGILLSSDGGQSWRDVRYPIDLDVHSVIFDPNRANTIYAATGGGENFPDPTPPPKGRPLYRSLDGGHSWESISDTFERTYSVPVRVHPKDPQTLYIGVAEQPPPLWLNRPTKANGALMRSSDGGANWEQLGAGLPNPFTSMVECIDFDPDEPDNVFIGTGGEGARFIKLTDGEIFHSPDRGDHWEKIPLHLPIIYALAVR
ncbi:MAG TPA: hypothetical protein VNL14_02510 [Candidatus Acidoferrales bacterium]|nr:hypothetical protein [Candidatus Acidoferrales bacterium]